MVLTAKACKTSFSPPLMSIGSCERRLRNFSVPCVVMVFFWLVGVLKKESIQSGGPKPPVLGFEPSYERGATFEAVMSKTCFLTASTLCCFCFLILDDTYVRLVVACLLSSQIMNNRFVNPKERVLLCCKTEGTPAYRRTRRFFHPVKKTPLPRAVGWVTRKSLRGARRHNVHQYLSRLDCTTNKSFNAAYLQK